MLSRNECLVAVQTELDAIDASYMVNRTSRHIKVTFKIDDKPHTATIPKTPSDWRSVKNARAQIRRLIRDAGGKPSDQTKFNVRKVRKALEEQAPVLLEEAAKDLGLIELPPKELPPPKDFDPQPIYDRMAKIEADLHALADLLTEIKPQIINNHQTIVKKPYIPRIRRRAV